MSRRYKAIPVAAARRVAKDFAKDQVIIVTWDKAHGKTHVTTYGRTVEDCAQAATGGNAVKRALGWPESLCNAEPPRVTKLKAIAGAAEALAVAMARVPVPRDVVHEELALKKALRAAGFSDG